MRKSIENVRRTLRMAGIFLAVLWIIAGTLFYIVRFSTIFYYGNRAGIDSLLKNLM